MPKPYSMDIRTRVIKKHLAGKSVIEITKELEVKATFVYDTIFLYKTTIVFLDETGINIGMTRLYGRALGEERVIDYVPDVRFDRVNYAISYE